ncbi:MULTISPECIES: HNH endonuclease [Methylotenera]|uniref:HNH endonuclease n=1 Tax=Methylotenera TaxID=359407 RepID=UPI00035F9F0F|nr:MULTISPECIES: HNH endonuclease signature motif containing protein [Methylotenera]
MAVYNTPSDTANTAVRSFLTSVGEYYLKKSFNTGSGSGKKIWDGIRKEFNDLCAYCGEEGKLQIEHLIMFNRLEYGLHHPGNVVPVCNDCNKRKKDSNKKYASWEKQLANMCDGDSSKLFILRKNKILKHMETYNYPKLSSQERHAIRVIAESLYENIKGESEKSLNMYRKLDEAFVQIK